MGIYDALNNYIEENIYPFHMPGHKHNKNFLSFKHPFLSYDITEFDEMDNLHTPTGILKDMNNRIASIFGGDNSFLLVNGSSSGLIAAITTVCGDGDKILVARNCHKAVFSGLIYSGAMPMYISPSITPDGLIGTIDPMGIEKALCEDSDIKAVLLTSPTYEGFVSDIAEIAKITHDHGKILIVDEAHGSHFKFGKIFPQTALEQGADIVIQSLHKTLPTFTQTAVLHTKGDRVDLSRLATNISMAQTTSPSYIFMAGVDRCLEFLENGTGFTQYQENLMSLRQKLSENKNLQLLEGTVDASKITILIRKDISGKDIDKILRSKYGVQLELSSRTHLIAMTSVCDTSEGFNRLQQGLAEIDKEISTLKDVLPQAKPQLPLTKIALPPRKASQMPCKTINTKDAVGEISAQFVTPYPPGIPLITPGEIISKEIVDSGFLEENVRVIANPLWSGIIKQVLE